MGAPGLAQIADAAGLRHWLEEAFAAVPGEDDGVLHVASVWRPRGEDRNVVLRIGEQTPKSDIDFLLLNLARARAEAIVTTGRILREEATVTHDLQGPPGVRAALHEWRVSLGLVEPPWLVVLTSGRDFDPGHAAFHGWARPIVLCPESSAAGLERRVEGTSIEVVGQPAPSLRHAIGYLRMRGATRISIEAGPSTASEAYRSPALVDELLLSVYLEPGLSDGVAGGDLPAPSEVERRFGPARATFAASEASGRWHFERYRCAIVSGEASSG